MDAVCSGGGGQEAEHRLTRAAAVLSHVMGAGKTFQVISFIWVLLKYTTAKKVMCIVPINVVQNWLAEFIQW